ncbi:hypothetical protein MS2017_1327 [Bathymodiolus thermophilus thioautotrophic gill symbiont]|uniref:Uncharacterized protein n=1 Tax=Bathymodiolus thermophilus thioautotrophic gill symbiont TaxID=2360 RepID=A0A3G3IMR4_9GAMM|nr:hypothetical protein MS2017_1327 [Bathymodiolus thermophilus thioautotrophic gill symbiont]
MLFIYKDLIIDLVENSNDTKKIQEMVKNWEVPSYNDLKDGRGKHHNFEVYINGEGYIKNIFVVSERNCMYILGYLLMDALNIDKKSIYSNNKTTDYWNTLTEFLKT